MKRISMAGAVLLLVLGGCKTVTVESDSEARARQHMHLADSLESVSAYREAAFEYGIVAELYPHSSFYPAAARQAAFLHLHPDNDGANDSIALYWFHEYMKASPPSPERRAVEVCVSLLERIQALEGAIELQKATSDSLAAVTKRQAGEMLTLSGRAKQVQALEAELKKANEELEKLREVDVRVSKGREK